MARYSSIMITYNNCKPNFLWSHQVNWMAVCVCECYGDNVSLETCAYDKILAQSIDKCWYGIDVK